MPIGRRCKLAWYVGAAESSRSAARGKVLLQRLGAIGVYTIHDFDRADIVRLRSSKPNFLGCIICHLHGVCSAPFFPVVTPHQGLEPANLGFLQACTGLVQFSKKGVEVFGRRLRREALENIEILLAKSEKLRLKKTKEQWTMWEEIRQNGKSFRSQPQCDYRSRA
jgi:hypothetical protein